MVLPTFIQGISVFGVMEGSNNAVLGSACDRNAYIYTIIFIILKSK